MLTFSHLLHLIYPASQVNVVGITWGSWEPQLLKLAKQDLIISSDCFYDPGITITNYHINNLKNNFFNFFFLVVFEPILVTVSYLLEKNPSASFICSYKERSSDWSLEPFLSKWKLSCGIIEPSNIFSNSVVDVAELTQDNSIQLFEIRRQS